MSETPINTNNEETKKEPEKMPVKLPPGSGSLPTKEQQEALDKLFDVMKNPKHYNITVHSEDNDKKLKFTTGLKLIEGEFDTDSADMALRVSGVDISMCIGGVLPNEWMINNIKTHVENGYDEAYKFADWLWSNKKVY